MGRFVNPITIRIIAAGLAIFAVNAIARLLTRWIYASQNDELIPGLWVYGATALVGGVIAFIWVRHALVSAVAGRLFWSGLIAAGLIAITGNVISGGAFFPGWSLLYVMRIVLLITVIAVGVALGILVAISFGVDALGKAWQAQAARIKSSEKPKRADKNRQ